jgi:hypothetical protein
VSESELTSTEHSERSLQRSQEADDRFNAGRSAELLVGARLVELGFDVFYPFSDRTSVDLVSIWKDHATRIQIRARWVPRERGGATVMTGGINPRTADVLLAYLHKPECYYIVPTDKLGGAKSLIFYPGGRSQKSPHKYWDEWRDRWDILKKS